MLCLMTWLFHLHYFFLKHCAVFKFGIGFNLCLLGSGEESESESV